MGNTKKSAARTKEKENVEQGANCPSTTTSVSENVVETSEEKSEGLAESDEILAPEEAIKEEEQLRQEREGANKAALQDIFQTEEGAGELSAIQFKQLDSLIEKTKLYSEFLAEQIQENKKMNFQDMLDEEDEGTTQAGQKRKGGSKGKGSSKRAKNEQSTTKTFLPRINGELRDYQLKGVQWMVSLWQNGLSGILADQMGLGKTIQTIGFLSHLVDKNIKGPFMIVAPLSTLSNWISEFERFCPSIPTVLYHGNKKERQDLQRKHFSAGSRNGSKLQPVLITSYEIVIADSKWLSKLKWNYIIVDEGHRLKNWDCKLVRELKSLSTANKLVLTGTPLQNNLSELWSLLNFLLPEVFASLSTFESWFDFKSITDGSGSSEAIAAQEQRNKVVSKLHAVLKPFLLRRIKADVETSLPAKKEIVLYAHMTDKQKEFNEQLRTRTLNEVMEKQQAAEGGLKKSSAKLNNMIMQMRKNCNHPDLISAAFSNEIYFPSSDVLLEQSGKLQLLNRLLKQLKADSHKVLIFSQMTRMLDVLDTFLEQEGHGSVRLDGSVSWQDRQAAISKFKDDPEIFCFLLSTRAGGLGINLTAADTVIIYDSDWNPQQDMQAMDRAHRIGQEKPVLVLRLATANSVEGRMLRRANSKLMLEKLVIRKGAFLPLDHPGQDKKDATGLSAQELMELLKDTRLAKDEPQSGVVSDQMLKKLLDRKHLEDSTPAPYKDADVGYEVVNIIQRNGLLSTVQ